MPLLKTASWYLVRPRMYRELGRRVWHKAFGSQRTAPTAEEASSWCAARAIDSNEAVRRIAGVESRPLNNVFPEVFAAAMQAEERCPVKMGAPADLELLYYLARHVDARRVLETGVAYRWSSLALLLSMSEQRDGVLVSTDMPYVLRGGDSYVGCVVPASLRPGWVLLRYPDREALPRALKRVPEIDLCHYDSHKDYDARMWAYPKMWAALRAGGIFISDDIGDDRGFRDFSEHNHLDPIVVSNSDIDGHGRYVGILQKP